MNNSEPIHINADSFEAAVTKSPVPVIVDFWAPRCPPCRMIAPLLDEIAREKAGAVRIAKVNTDDEPELAVRFGIRNIPTLLMFNNGQVKDTIVGLVAKREIVSKIDAVAAGA
ncbi:MAG TPA: thioredoxin [Chthoniobacteraceae bacterium]|nr:thioredoxin [Chthoniobacteraceae bacterium]